MRARVFLGGEGPNELGSLALERSYRPDPLQPGVLETLLRGMQPDGWQVADAMKWKDIVKFQANGAMDAERRNVLGLALEAERANAHALAFLRDTDGDERRERAIHSAIAEARTDFPTLEIIGGTPKPLLEAWLLALAGENKTESLSKAQAVKRLAKHLPKKDTAAMVDYVRAAQPFNRVAKDAAGLHQWIGAAKKQLKKISKWALLH